MLAIEGLDCFYGDVQVLRGLTLSVAPGETLCLTGRNGAGKTTLMKAIMGLVRARAGRIVLDGTEISALPPDRVPKAGVGYVPQGRRLFSELTVRENLEIGLMARGRGKPALEAAIALFPVLAERMGQRSGTLSGGEQQMLAMARALCLEPKLLLLDEPTEGLMPSMIAAIRQSVAALKATGVSVILVEQRVEAVLDAVDRVAFLENGQLRETVSAEAIRADRSLIDRYVGIGH
ncbi:ABC transporter ATP-binding protein [Methylobrevis albus]|uniref:ABC transporter ATP-binding protein n=1 Tax=Methylobrevis albus TaxID=2793297 RepID=A0A931MXV7_9HYPH|nr:ABC transporter ATP-binding protein [Methylobrevis albus]MBH0236409.1 ABC transporter ATP-binding protein [Methylobrevis albus]